MSESALQYPRMELVIKSIVNVVILRVIACGLFQNIPPFAKNKSEKTNTNCFSRRRKNCCDSDLRT